jgi:hypothetical protein
MKRAAFISQSLSLMKTKAFLLLLFLGFGLLGYAQNPFQDIGVEVKPLTLSKGKYDEFHDGDSVVRIGNALFNVHSEHIVGFMEGDTLYDETTLQPEVMSRWLSPDPLAAEFPSWSPYVFVGDNPIWAIDPNGEYIYIVINGEKYLVTYPMLQAAKIGDVYNYALKVAYNAGMAQIKENLNSRGHDIYFVFKDVEGSLQDRWHEALPNAQKFNKGSDGKFEFDEEAFVKFSKENAPWSKPSENNLATYAELNGTDVSASKGTTYSLVFLNNEDVKLGENPMLKDVLDKVFQLAFYYIHETGAHVDERNNPLNPGGYHNGEGKRMSDWDSQSDPAMDAIVKEKLSNSRKELVAKNRSNKK